MQLQVNNSIRLEIVDENHHQALYALAEQNLPHLSKWLDWTSRCTDSSFMLEFTHKCQAEYNEGKSMPFVIFWNNQLVGRVGLYNLHAQEAEIGYWLGAEFEKKGIATDSCRAVLRFAFRQMQLNRIVLKCATENSASRKLAEKLGFRYVKLEEKAEIVNGKVNDLRCYELTNKDLS